MPVKNPSHFGSLMMLCAALCFSTGGLLCKLVSWAPLAISGARCMFGFLVIGVFLLLTHYRLRFNLTVLLGAVSMCGVTTLFVISNKLTTAANAIILQYSAPIWIILFMAVLFHVKPTRADLLTVMAVFVGILCFFLDGLSGGSLPGNCCAVLSGVFYGILFMLNQFPDGDSLSSMFFGQVITMVLFAPQVVRETDFETETLLAVAALGIVQVGIAYIFFSIGTKYTRPITASLISGIEPVLNPLWVAIFWGERLTPLSMVGAVIVLVSILIYNLLGAKASEKARAGEQ